jgi:hypothetical protein
MNIGLNPVLIPFDFGVHGYYGTNQPLKKDMKILKKQK